MSAEIMDKSLYSCLDERLGLESIAAVASKKKVPLHKSSLWYYMGGIALVLMMIQFVTGILLMFYYVPEINSAYSSVLFINSQVEFGWFFRSMHSWGANILVAAVMLHMISAYFMKAYYKPRELTWLTGMGLLVLCFGFGFTGYLLPWDEIAFFATKIGLDITASLPFVGEITADILRGGAEVGQGTLSRFFVIHVIILPLALFALLGVHLVLVQLHGMSEPKFFQDLPKEKKSYEAFFPNFVLKDIMVWLLVVNVLAALVAFMPWGLGPEADAYAPAPEGIKPEWYFLAMFQFLKFIPPHVGPFEGEMVGMFIFACIGGVFAFAPFINREQSPQIAQALDLFGILVAIGFAAFTIWGFVA